MAQAKGTDRLNLALDHSTMALLRNQSAREHCTITDTIRRNAWIKEKILELITSGQQLATVQDGTVIPPGVTLVHILVTM